MGGDTAPMALLPTVRPVSVHVGCAGWNLPRDFQDEFPGADTGTHLQRYAARLPAVEIDSSFYRPHRPETYARWAAGVPQGFRFAVKLPRTITQQRRLADCADLLETFLDQTAGLGQKLGCLLVQLPPSLALDKRAATAFFRTLRERHSGAVACEPRHATWFSPQGESLLKAFRIARVAADPPRAPTDGEPGGDTALVYYRLHGTPRIYYSDYPPEVLETLVSKLGTWLQSGSETWCIFDNTALGAATGNALSVSRRTAAPESADTPHREAPTSAVRGRAQHRAIQP